MKKLTILSVYATKPDIRYGTGGVRRFLTLFSKYARSKHVEFEYYTMFDKYMNFGSLSPLCNLFFAIALFIRLMHFCQKKEAHYVLYAHDALYSGLVATLIGKIRKMPVVLHYHNSPGFCYLTCSPSNFLTKIGYSAIHFIERFVLKSSHSIIVTNSVLKKFVNKLGVPESNLVVLPMAIPVKNFQASVDESEKFREKIRIPASTFVLGYVGRLSTDKNLDTLVKAFSMFAKEVEDRNVRCVLVGDGTERRNLEELVTQLKLDNYVVFTGFTYNILPFLSRFDVFILPSRSEGSPLALIEAMASGRSIIASDIPAIREIVKNGKEALLFDPNKPEQLKAVILKLYNNPDLRKKLGENAIKKAKYYDVDKVFPKILEVCQGILKS